MERPRTSEGVAMLTVPGSVAVVTGASSGIGPQLAVELAAADATVLALARREARLGGLAELLRQSSPESGFVVCDVSDTDRYAGVLREIEADRGRIDILINNAAIPEPEIDGLARHRALMETNYFAVVAGTLPVLPPMPAPPRGGVLNVASDSPPPPPPGAAGPPPSHGAGHPLPHGPLLHD